LLAAGLDTRAFRLSWPPDTRFFELDQAPVLSYKEEILEAAHARAACQRQALATDLAAPWAQTLENAGFARQQPAVWLLEGFLFYLPNDVTARLVDTVTGLSAPGSWLGCDVVNETMLVSPLTRDWLEMQARAGAPWIGTMDDPVAFLGARGWEVTLTQAGAADAHYGRWPFPVIPTTMPNMPHNWFVTGHYPPMIDERN
jgi:methyltransferase (TIGR00027 family)